MINELLTLTKKLISFQTTSEHSQELVSIMKYCEEQLKDFSIRPFSSHQRPSLLVSNRDKTTNDFTIIFNAHLDVIPAEAEQFEPFEKDGKLYGRGALDMKSGAAVMILLFKELAKKVSYPIALQLTPDEESGGADGTGYQVAQGIRGKFVITGEATGLRIINKAKGRLIIKLIASGISAHAAYPWRGDNAIWRMQQALGKLVERYPFPQKEVDHTTINIAKIETTNTAYNKIPEDCIAYIDIRYNPEEKDTIFDTIKTILPLDIKIEIIRFAPAHNTNRDNEYIELLQKAGQKQFQKNFELAQAHGASDIPYYNAVGCDGIEFGALGEGHHGKEEFVDITSLENYYNTLEAFLLEVENRKDLY